MAKAKSKSAKSAMSQSERNWSFVLITVAAAAVLIGVWYFTSNPNWGSNGNLKAVTAPAATTK